MKIYAALFLIACAIVTAIFFATPFTQGQKENQDEATEVMSGRTTDEERAYSKEFEKMYPHRRRMKLSEVRKDIKSLGIGLGGIVDTIDIPGADPLTTESFLHNLSCQSDAIVIGYPVSKAAHLSEDETFVYTEYDYVVTDVIKNNTYSQLVANSEIRVARPGGDVKLNNRLIHVADEAFEPLSLKKTFLLFLKFVPSADGYMVAGTGGDFQFENGSFKKLSKGIVPNELTAGGKSSELLSKVYFAIQEDCK